MIRPAKGADIPAIVDLIHATWARSIYAGSPVDIDDAVVKKMAVNAIMRHGRIGVNGMAAFVAEHDGRIVGVIVGVLDRIYGVATMLQATDLLCATAENAPITALLGLVRAFDAWWQSDATVYEAVHGATNIIPDTNVARLFEATGRTNWGTMWRMRNPGREA